MTQGTHPESEPPLDLAERLGARLDAFRKRRAGLWAGVRKLRTIWLCCRFRYSQSRR